MILSGSDWGRMESKNRAAVLVAVFTIKTWVMDPESPWHPASPYSFWDPTNFFSLFHHHQGGGAKGKLVEALFAALAKTEVGRPLPLYNAAVGRGGRNTGDDDSGATGTGLKKKIPADDYEDFSQLAFNPFLPIPIPNCIDVVLNLRSSSTWENDLDFSSSGETSKKNRFWRDPEFETASYKLVANRG